MVSRFKSQEALAMRDELIERIGMMQVPEGVIDMIINEFGVNDVAEITGRKT